MQVQLHQIALTLAGRRVLAGLDLTTHRNEYVVILGPSGCGKTSTLRIIAGLQQPDSGEILFDETPVTAVAPRQRGVAMVFQHDGLYPHLTVEKSIRLGVVGKIADSEFEARLKQASELTRIEGLLDRYPDQLSGGELRRAAVAKAIVRQSSIRLLDEPLSALDASARHSLQEDILRWHREIPGTTIHVTHDGYEAMRMADRIAILDAGKIIQFDSPECIYRRPSHINVALAIGSPCINLVPASTSRGELVSTDPRIKLQSLQIDDNGDRDVLVGIRPESFRAQETHRDTRKDDSFEGIEIAATLMEVRQGIQDCVVHAHLNEKPIHGVMPDSRALATVQAGETIRLRADRSGLHLFDATSGLRLDGCTSSKA